VVAVVAAAPGEVSGSNRKGEGRRRCHRLRRQTTPGTATSTSHSRSSGTCRFS